MSIDEIKEMVAERHNYADNILGNRWDFAMMITHRKKKQLQLYEEVILELSERLEKAETLDKNKPKALIIDSVSVPKGEQCAHNNEPILDKNGHYECPDCKRYGENC